jgi:hypothetical protein
MSALIDIVISFIVALISAAVLHLGGTATPSHHNLTDSHEEEAEPTTKTPSKPDKNVQSSLIEPNAFVSKKALPKATYKTQIRSRVC